MKASHWGIILFFLILNTVQAAHWYGLKYEIEVTECMIGLYDRSPYTPAERIESFCREK